jgi:diacylglycerol kinase (ATP)
MQNTSSQKLFFVINPISGGKEKHDWEREIREFLKDSHHTMEFYLLTGDEADKTSVQHYIETLQPHKVVAVGGDGTVKSVAELIQGTTTSLGILPAGSANGMARELELPLTAKEALDVIINGEEKKIDLIKVNEHICIHLSDIGLNALLVKYFEQSKKRGMWGYGKAIFRVLWQKRKMYATIKTDEATYKRKAYMIVLANARKYGTGANINPDGDLSDGKFEVVVLRKLNLLEIFKAIFTDQSFHPRRIEVFSTTQVQLSVLRKTYFQVDGEFLGKLTKIDASIMPHSLSIMLPKQA